MSADDRDITVRGPRRRAHAAEVALVAMLRSDHLRLSSPQIDALAAALDVVREQQKWAHLPTGLARPEEAPDA